MNVRQQKHVQHVQGLIEPRRRDSDIVAKVDVKKTAEMDEGAIANAVAGGLLPQEERETLRRAQVLVPRDAFPLREADTLTAPEYGPLTEDSNDDGSTATLPQRRPDHSLRRAETASPPPPGVDDEEREERRDTMPAPPIASASDPMTARGAYPLPPIASGGTVTLTSAPVSLLSPPPPAPATTADAKSAEEVAPPPPPSHSPLPPIAPPPPPSSRSCVSPLPTRLGTPRAGSPLPPPPVPIPIPPLDDEDNILDGEDLLEDDYEDTTQASTGPVQRPSGDDQTSPTLSLANRSDASREVYRLFLASEYAPALELANELIAQGDDDPMLITIARECRSSLANPNQTPSSVPPSLDADTSSDDTDEAVDVSALGQRTRLSLRTLVTGQTTMDELSTLTGLSLDQILRLLDDRLLERLERRL